MKPSRYLISAALLFAPLLAHAHIGQGDIGGGLLAGFSHPIRGLDHVIAMVAVGMWGAQLGRPAVVQDVSNKLVDQFAECIKAQLSASPEMAAAAVDEAQKPISGFSLAIAALSSAIKRLLGRGDGREKGGSA